MTKQPQDMVDASRDAATLPVAEQCTLPSGRKLTVRRLSWLEFERVWRALCGIISALLLADEEITEERLTSKLTCAPQVIGELVAVATQLEPDELSGWSFDDVLAAAAFAAQFNFVDSQGIRDFFSVAQLLAGRERVDGKAGP